LYGSVNYVAYINGVRTPVMDNRWVSIFS